MRKIWEELDFSQAIVKQDKPKEKMQFLCMQLQYE